MDKKPKIRYSNSKNYTSPFPNNVLDMSSNYVYFNSLELQTELYDSESGKLSGKIIFDTMKPNFNIGGLSTNTSINSTNNKIEIAFDFLDKVIQSEYQKEYNFLQFLRNETKAIKNFTVP